MADLVGVERHDGWCAVCHQVPVAGRCACASGPSPGASEAGWASRSLAGVPTLRDRRSLLSASGSRWRPSHTEHGFWGRAAWSVLPVLNLTFWTCLGIWRMPLALLVLGPIMLVPSIWALRRIWQHQAG